MLKTAAVWCKDPRSLQAIEAALVEAGMVQVICRSKNEAMELAVGGKCSALIVDFDLPEASEVAKLASRLSPPQRPVLLAMSHEWPETGPAFQSGANRILYKPLGVAQVKEACTASRKPMKGSRRKSARIEMKTLVYLELASGTVPAVGINISAHGIAVQATEAVPLSASLPFHCVLPGTHHKLRGHVDVIWADEEGRAGAFFSDLGPTSRKHLQHWLSKHHEHDKDAARILLPPDSASFSAPRG
jgi:hypothetical protein